MERAGSEAARLAAPSVRIDLDANGVLAPWRSAVEQAAEPCLLVDAGGRLGAISGSAALLLATTPAAAAGLPLDRLLIVIDFTSQGLPATELAAALPVLRSVTHQVLTRGLFRVRGAAGQALTFDMIATPLVGGVGALAFLLPL